MAGNERCGSKGKALAKPNTARVNNHALIQTRLSKAGQVNFNYHTVLFFFFLGISRRGSHQTHRNHLVGRKLLPSSREYHDLNQLVCSAVRFLKSSPVHTFLVSHPGSP